MRRSVFCYPIVLLLGLASAQLPSDSSSVTFEPCKNFVTPDKVANVAFTFTVKDAQVKTLFLG